mmetsp:Transcript_21070/g.44065  ORF Transcript_21070/g.44065 Transcript_21070/m.44065 type:complete len:366 (-) Transcript_21070:221-1318(-)
MHTFTALQPLSSTTTNCNTTSRNKNKNNNNNNASDPVPRGGHNPPKPNTPLPPHKQILLTLQRGYRQRLAADPSFLAKSILEIIVAASTQFTAEVSRRGWDRMAVEGDFVFSGVLTAVFGKYFSMWRVAKTVQLDDDIDCCHDGNHDDDNESENEHEKQKKQQLQLQLQLQKQHPSSWRDKVPNNAFQPTLLDGRTKPTLPSRLLAFLLPMPQLFRAGVISSTIGYGLTYLLTALRTILMERGIIPFYDVRTEPVSVPLAAIYTGVFMAVVSNVRYQILQGVVEPYLIDGGFDKLERGLDALESRLRGMRELGMLSRLLRGLNGIEFWRKCKGVVIVLVRWGNGLLGSWIAIGGMRACGLQKMKG